MTSVVEAMSCQPCGCDAGCKGGPYVCERHRQEALIVPATATITVSLPSGASTAAQSEERIVGIGGAPTRPTTMPDDALGRKRTPIASGVLDYFPDAIVAVAQVSWAGNEQHNPGQPLHWDRSKSMDEADTAMRHFMQRGTVDTDGQRHSAKAAWRLLALLQKEIEASRDGQ